MTDTVDHSRGPFKTDPAAVRLAFGMIVSAAAIPLSRTAYLHVDYRRVTPIDEPLIVRGGVTSVAGRKAYLTAAMTTLDGTVLTAANGLMVALLPHHS